MKKSRLLFFSLMIVPAAWAAAAPPPRLRDVRGDVQYQARGAGSWGQALAEQALAPGDSLKTGPDAGCVLVFVDGSKVKLEGGTAVALESPQGPGPIVRVQSGLVEAWVRSLAPYEFRTATGEALTRGVILRLQVDRSGAASWDVFEGALALRDKKGRGASLDAGRHAGVDAHGEMSPLEHLSATLLPEPEPLTSPGQPPEQIPVEAAAAARETVESFSAPPPPPPNPGQNLDVVSPSAP